MADTSRTQVGTILLPIALIIVVVPVAVFIALNWDDWRNDSNQGETPRRATRVRRHRRRWRASSRS